MTTFQLNTRETVMTTLALCYALRTMEVADNAYRKCYDLRRVAEQI
jgi:hypothetical protein